MLKVLVVEDEAIIRKGLIYTFDWMSSGCTVIGEAEDGHTGLKMIEELLPDIVIADIRMPGIDGLEMIESASKTHSFCSILLTSYSMFQYAKKAVTLKVFEYLLKPVDEQKLEETLKKAGKQIEQTRILSSLEKNMRHNLFTDPDIFLRRDLKLNYYVEQALRLIKNNYNEKLNISKIAEDMGVSKSYLSRKFKQHTSHTFVELLNQYRVKNAIKILEQGNVRISEVATQVGFSEYKHFSNVFRRYVGMACTDFLNSKVHCVQSPQNGS